MLREETLVGPPQRVAKVIRSFLPFPLVLERCDCPICSGRKTKTLMRFDQFGFPIGTVECEECGFIYTNPRPTESYMRTFYEKYFWFFFQGRHEIGERFFRRQRTREWAALRFTRSAPYLRGARSVLEIGAGSGLFLDQVRKNFPGISVAGIEPDSPMAKYCCEELRLEVHNGFFQDYPGKDVFDVIVLFHVIEHLFDFTALFKFIREHLAPGGTVIVEAPNVDGEWKSIYMIQLSHLHIFSPRTIKNLFSSKGFDIVEVRCLENDLDESNLMIVGRMGGELGGKLSPRDLQESERIRTMFEGLPSIRGIQVLRAWIRLAYFALRP